MFSRLLLVGRFVSNVPEAAAALRPFFLKIHPDLFRQHTIHADVNERALQQLNGALAQRATGNVGAAFNLFFYVKGKSRCEFDAVNVRIDLADLNRSVRSLLEAVSLPTEHLPASQRADASAQARSKSEWRSVVFDGDIDDMPFRPKPRPWYKPPDYFAEMSALVTQSIKVQEAFAAQVLSCQELAAEICVEKNLKSIFCSDSDAIARYRGALNALRRVTEGIRDLQGLLVEFCTDRRSCVLPCGNLSFNLTDVPEYWLKSIQVRFTSNEVIEEIRELNRAIETMGSRVEPYRSSSHLDYLPGVRILKEVCQRIAVPSDVEFQVGGRSFSNMVTRDGKLLINPTVSVEKIIDFVKESHAEAREIKAKFEQDQQEINCRVEDLADLGVEVRFRDDLPVGSLVTLLDYLLQKRGSRDLNGWKLFVSVPKRIHVRNDGFISIPVTLPDDM